MATKIQFRRGTAQQWDDTNPILSNGEAGFETDTGRFKVGNGATAWRLLPSISKADAVAEANEYTDDKISELVGGAIESLDTLKELAEAIGDDPEFFTTLDSRIDLAEADIATKLTAEIEAGHVWIGNSESEPVVVELVTANVPEDGNLYFTADRAQDAVAAAIAAGTHVNVSIVYDDENNTISFTGAQTYDDNDAVGAVAAAIAAGTHSNVSITFDDANNKLSFASTITNEEVQDAMKDALVHAFHTNVSISYNDAQNRFEVQSSGGGGGGGGGTSIGDSAPLLPVIGDLWFRNTTGKFYVNDGVYWVEIASLLA
jgi:plasmid maintenance system antidote protein VapI